MRDSRWFRWLSTGWGDRAFQIYFVVYLIYILFPLAVLVLYAFHSTEYQTWPMKGLTLQWFRELLDDSKLLLALKNSVLIGLATMFFSTLIGGGLPRIISGPAPGHIPDRNHAALRVAHDLQAALQGCRFIVTDHCSLERPGSAGFIESFEKGNHIGGNPLRDLVEPSPDISYSKVLWEGDSSGSTLSGLMKTAPS